MKLVFILIVLGIIGFVIYRRIKPYLNTARQIYKVLNGGPRQDLFDTAGRKAEGKTAKLIKCDSCGTWVPAERAVNLRGGLSFCSQECVQSKVRNSRVV